jgi:hypothetical protein
MRLFLIVGERRKQLGSCATGIVLIRENIFFIRGSGGQAIFFAVKI